MPNSSANGSHDDLVLDSTRMPDGCCCGDRMVELVSAAARPQRIRKITGDVRACSEARVGASARLTFVVTSPAEGIVADVSATVNPVME
jgi:hypothetical protein